MPRLRPFAFPLLLLAGCAPTAGAPAGSAPPPELGMSTAAPSPDPRVGLKAGWMDAGEAAWNLRVVSKTPPSSSFYNPDSPGDRRLVNSDLAFMGRYAIQGNYSGWQVWDVTNPARPTLAKAYVCPGSQSDVSVFRNLLFVSGEATSGRLDCGLEGVQDTVSHERLRGIRIFDMTDMANPRYLANVQTCRGSHTHTVVEDPRDPANVYIYVSGSAPIRSPSELPGCSARPIDEDSTSAYFRIEVIRVPLAAPQTAAIVSSPRIFEGLTAPPRHAEPVDSAALARRAAAQAAGGAAARFAGRRPNPGGQGGPNQCHDITVYPALGLAGGACAGYGLLLDISDAAHPRRIGAVADSNFSFWHSATFNNEGTKILFSDEWGGGAAPRCRVTDKMQWGADAIFSLTGNRMTFQSYYKMPAPQTEFENCVAHNGSLIPVPGRDIMVQAWYQGGISVFDWTDPAHPVEIAYHDRGPMDAAKLVDAGSWSVYWYNGYLYSSEISRGLDVFELLPSGFLTRNEIEAAKLVHLDYLNVQDQPKLVWPPSFVVARALVDQLTRSRGLSSARLGTVRSDLAAAEQRSGSQRSEALTRLSAALDRDAAGSSDPAKVRMLASAVRELATR